jgi:RHS repeat-associated protein
MGGTPVGQPFGFTGREHELDGGLVYARARYLSSATGVWNRPDPLRAALRPEAREDVAARLLYGRSSEMSAAGYVNDNPVSFTDPLGLLTFSPLWLHALPPGVQWFDIGVGIFSYTLDKVETAALVRPLAKQCDGCAMSLILARREIWMGNDPAKVGYDGLLGRMRMYLAMYVVLGTGLEGANTGHRQQIVEKQAKVAGYASAMILQCLDPDLKQLGEWYLYLATVILP